MKFPLEAKFANNARVLKKYRNKPCTIIGEETENWIVEYLSLERQRIEKTRMKKDNINLEINTRGKTYEEILKDVTEA